MPLLVILLAVLVVAGITAGLVVSGRRTPKGPALEPPPSASRRITPRPTAKLDPEPVLDLDDADLNEPSSGVGVAPRPGEVPPDEIDPNQVVEPDADTVAEIED